VYCLDIFLFLFAFCVGVLPCLFFFFRTGFLRPFDIIVSSVGH
jgi:hypothetical protein